MEKRLKKKIKKKNLGNRRDFSFFSWCLVEVMEKQRVRKHFCLVEKKNKIK